MTKREGQTLLLFDSNQGYSRHQHQGAYPSLPCPPYPKTVIFPPFSLPLSLCRCTPTNTNSCILKKPAHVHIYRRFLSSTAKCTPASLAVTKTNMCVSSVQQIPQKSRDGWPHYVSDAIKIYASIQLLLQGCKLTQETNIFKNYNSRITNLSKIDTIL